MFTGIIEEIGKVRTVQRRAATTLVTVESSVALEGVRQGDSIAVNGVCLTVVRYGAGTMSFEVMEETLRTTTIGFLKPGEKVNLERSLKSQDRLSGHFVTGHIDTVGTIRKRHYRGNNLSFQIEIPVSLMRYVVKKGSVAVDGISLTVVDTFAHSFTVYLIPHTLQATTMEHKGTSAKVNIECDILAKYAQARLC